MSELLEPEEKTKEDDMAIPLRKPEPVKTEKRAIHFFLNGEGVSRLDYLISKVYPHKQTGVIAKAIQLFDLMFREHEKGTKFYIQRKGKEIECFDIFD